MTKSPTLEDVARVSGVSRATASRVVRGDVNVRAEKVDAVHRAVSQLGYIPNVAARSLVTRRTGAVAVIIPEPDARFFADPFFGTAVAAISAELAAHDTQLLLVLSGSDTDGDRVHRFVRGHHADGIIVMSHHEGSSSLAALGAAEVPIVFIGRPLTEGGATFVDVDNVQGGRMAAARLIDQGRGRLATITGALDMPAGIDRQAGFAEEVERRGAELVAIEAGDFSATSGEAAARRLLDSGERIDGVFAGNDLMAIGALRCFTAAGIRAPADIALVGFDDIAIAAEPINDLTTIANPAGQLGSLASTMLLRALAGEDPEPIVIKELTLKIRSTG